MGLLQQPRTMGPLPCSEQLRLLDRADLQISARWLGQERRDGDRDTRSDSSEEKQKQVP